MSMYDIFISYRTTHSAWVVTLAKNLKAQGYTVFLDEWALVPGEDFAPRLAAALANSKCAILVATPDAADSGWVQQEYEQMLNMKAKKEGFFFIPVIFGHFPDMPFLENVKALDFNDESKQGYREAFGKLLCGIEKKAPGADCAFDGPLDLPAPSGLNDQELVPAEQTFISSLFEDMGSGLPKMILAQDYTNMQRYENALRKEAEATFGFSKVMQIYPPNSTRAESGAYFERLSRQCGFEPADTCWQWADALKDQLSDGKELLLLVTGFENGPDEPRRELAGELRQLHEQNCSLRLVMMGGKRLASHKYDNGQMSLLNIALDAPIPEPGVDDVRHVFSDVYPDLDLTDEELQEVLDFTGGHPLLLHHCLAQKAKSAAQCDALLQQSHLPGQLFLRFRDNASRDALKSLLQKEDLGPFDLWPMNRLLRNLYWRNLITNRNGRLRWRCEYIRKVGMEVVR